MHETIGGAALIIGAGGIGAAVAAKIADEGLPVIVADLDPARAEASVAPHCSDYAASKAGLISLVQSAAVSLAPHSIHVNAVCPGVVDTAMTRAIHAARATTQGISVEESLASLIDRIPLGRIETPDEVSDAIWFLLSDAARYVTGQALNVCGGLAFD